jgi:hypothetical protein
MLEQLSANPPPNPTFSWENWLGCYPELNHVDNWHLFHAWQAIAQRFDGKDSDNRLTFINTLQERVSVIWHVVESSSANQEFINFNSGKIPLAPCELIKAIFLSTETSAGAPLQRTTAEMAAEWDQMEIAFRDEEFWSFLNPPKEAYLAPNRITLLFIILKQDPKDEPAGTAYLSLLLGSEDKPKQIVNRWVELRRCFLTLMEWFSIREIRHSVGFIRWAKHSQRGAGIQTLWQEFKKLGRRAFHDWLTERVGGLIAAPQGRTYDDLSFDAPKDKPIIHDLLLWFNIATLPPHIDYPFANHAGIDWSLEHIHAQNASEIDEDDEAKLWLDGATKITQSLLESQSNKNQLDSLEVLLSTLKNMQPTSADLKANKTVINQFVSLLPASIETDMGKLWNMALLGTAENSALGNRFFHQKREKLLELEREGKFIPLATLRLFLKVYAGDVTQMMIWTPGDRANYRKAIEEVLTTPVSLKP